MNRTLITTEALTPIVMVLVEGGALSIRTVCQALESNVPLVVVKVNKIIYIHGNLGLLSSLFKFQIGIWPSRRSSC